MSSQVSDLVLFTLSFASFLPRAILPSRQVCFMLACFHVESPLTWYRYGAYDHREHSNVILCLPLFSFIIPQFRFPLSLSFLIHTCKIISKILFWNLKLKNRLLNSHVTFSSFSSLTLSSLHIWQHYLIYSHPVSTATPLKSHFHSTILTSSTVSWQIWLSWYIYLEKSKQAQNTIFSDCKTIAHNADNFSHKLGVRTDNIHTS